MAAPMIRPLMRILPFILGCLLVSVAHPSPVCAQLVREGTAQTPQQVPAKPDSQNTASAQTPKGKKRLSQEVQLTGDESWVDTGIDVQAGEHVLITSTGKLRYADAKDDNGPEGLPRSFKDLLRVLPLNEAGRAGMLSRPSRAGLPWESIRPVTTPVKARTPHASRFTLRKAARRASFPAKSVPYPASTTICFQKFPAVWATSKATPATW